MMGNMIYSNIKIHRLIHTVLSSHLECRSGLLSVSRQSFSALVCSARTYKYLFPGSSVSFQKTYKNVLQRNSVDVDYVKKNVKQDLYVNRNITSYHYSTKAPVELSLTNIKVQQYLNHLQNKYKSCLNDVDDEASMKEIITLKPVVQLLDQVEGIQSDIKDLQSLVYDSEGDKEMKQLAEQDLKDAQVELESLEKELFAYLVPEEPVDNTDIILEVSAGVGGQEAMLFCQQLFEMYQNYAEYMGWETHLTDYETTEIGGLRCGIVTISGESVYRLLKYEGGIHRVQRVPKTEKAGRIHTSTVSVAVMPQPSEVDVQILDKDLKIETKRASGSGGQHVNTTDSAVRIVHLPTGICVESQKERSQHQNKSYCLKKLRATLYQQQLEHNMSKYSSNRKLQVGTKGRSEKIRTYNFPQDRITDHRIGKSVHNLTSFLLGTDSLHSFVCSLLEEADKETLYELILGNVNS